MTLSIPRNLQCSITAMACFVVITLTAQHHIDFFPCKTYPPHSKELIAELRSMLEHEYTSVLQVISPQDRALVRRLYDQRIKHITNCVNAKLFIRNDSLESYATSILQRLTENYTSELHTRRVLISRSHEVNAMCYGRGIYIVTIGLLARITDEAELAFTLAHEMAHDELNHFQSSLSQEIKLKLEKKTKEQVKKILTGISNLRIWRNSEASFMA